MKEYKVSKIRTQWINNSADIRIREVNPLLRTKRNFKTPDEINKSVAELTFEIMRGPIQTCRHVVEWYHFAKWSESCSAVRAGLVIQEITTLWWEIERERERESQRHFSSHSKVGDWAMSEDLVECPSVGMR